MVWVFSEAAIVLHALRGHDGKGAYYLYVFGRLSLKAQL